MKKQILLFLFFASLFAVNAEDYTDRISKYGRWSINGDIGLNRFDGDIDPDYDLMGILTSPSFGVSLDYNLNPNVSIGWGVGSLFFDEEDANEKFTSGGVYTATFFSADLLSLVRGKKSRFWSMWLSPGVGISGSFFPKYTTTRTIQPDPVYSVVFPPAFFIFPIKFSIEYNITKSYSLGLNIKQVYTNTDQVESIHRYEYDDMWQTLSFSLRYKFITKEKKHFRDEVFDLEGSSTRLINLLQQDVRNLSIKVDGINNKLDSVDRRLEKLEGILSNDGADTDQDGVPDVRDLEPNTPRGNPVDFWGRSIGVKSVADNGILSVYFDFDSAELDKIAQITSIKVANKMKANPSLMLEIRGYTDNPGTGIYNQKLSQRRAERVKNELVKVHGISYQRMVANGKGKIPNPVSENLWNRRCDFFFSE